MDNLSTDLSRDPVARAVASYMATLASSSQLRMKGALELALHYLRPDLLEHSQAIYLCRWNEITGDVLEALGGQILRDYPNGPSASLAIIGIKQVCLRLAQSQAMPAEQWVPLSLVKSPKNGSRTSAEMYRLTMTEIRSIAEVVAADPRGAVSARDAAIFALLTNCGLRIGELSRLNVSDLLPDSQVIIRKSKGGRSRRVQLSGAALQIVHEYVENWRGAKDGPLFTPATRTGLLAVGGLFDEPRRLKVGPISKLIRQRCREAGVPDDVTAHSWRRHFATACVEKRIPLESVRIAMGHKNSSTTSGYLQADTDQAILECSTAAPYPAPKS